MASSKPTQVTYDQAIAETDFAGTAAEFIEAQRDLNIRRFQTEQQRLRAEQQGDPRSNGALQAISQQIRDEEKKRNKRGISTYNTYYYCGAQAQIYFNDILIDEVRDLQFTTVTNRQPIYGYASKLFDTVATGNLIVQGQFTINFVEAGYLNIIATALKGKDVNGISRLGETASVAQTATVFTNRNFEGTNGSAVVSSTATSQEQSEPIKTFRSNMEIQAYNQIRGIGNLEFRRMAEQAMRNKFGDKGIIERPVTRFDRMRPFDIFAVFGDYTNKDADHTVRRIKNVYLTGQSQTIISNGEPIGESYSFIARDIQ